MRQSLEVNRNGVICRVVESPGWVTSSIARDVRYAIEYRTTRGDWYRYASYDDAATAAQAFGESTKQNFRLRLVAFDQDNQVTLPHGWKPDGMTDILDW